MENYLLQMCQLPLIKMHNTFRRCIHGFRKIALPGVFVIPSSVNAQLFTEKTVSTFVKTKVLTEFSISTLGFSVSRIVRREILSLGFACSGTNRPQSAQLPIDKSASILWKSLKGPLCFSLL